MQLQRCWLKPSGVSVDSAGNIYIADTGNQRIRQISGGAVATVAGNGQQGFGGDSGPATAAILNSPKSGTAPDASGNLTIADTLNQRLRGLTLPTLTYANDGVGIRLSTTAERHAGKHRLGLDHSRVDQFHRSLHNCTRWFLQCSADQSRSGRELHTKYLVPAGFHWIGKWLRRLRRPGRGSAEHLVDRLRRADDNHDYTSPRAVGPPLLGRPLPSRLQ